jgi:flavin reductase (DIM6/NTAB) family NADH-FMN oxidoreductase RutF
MECLLLREPVIQERYDTFFGEVVSAQADSRVFADGRWTFDARNAGLHTLHHLGGGLFALPAQSIQAHMLPMAE